MSSPELIAQVSPRRSLRGYWTPLLLLAGAVMLPTMVALHATDAEPAGDAELTSSGILPPWLTLPLMSVALLASAIASEKSIRRQLALARVGAMADGTIDAVRRFRPTKKHSATWSFSAADGHIYQGRGMLNDIDAMMLTSGSPVRVCYDPSNPSNNRMESAFWAVEWE